MTVVDLTNWTVVNVATQSGVERYNMPVGAVIGVRPTGGGSGIQIDDRVGFTDFGGRRHRGTVVGVRAEGERPRLRIRSHRDNEVYTRDPDDVTTEEQAATRHQAAAAERIERGIRSGVVSSGRRGASGPRVERSTTTQREEQARSRVSGSGIGSPDIIRVNPRTGEARHRSTGESVGSIRRNQDGRTFTATSAASEQSQSGFRSQANAKDWLMQTHNRAVGREELNRGSTPPVFDEPRRTESGSSTRSRARVAATERSGDIEDATLAGTQYGQRMSSMPSPLRQGEVRLALSGEHVPATIPTGKYWVDFHGAYRGPFDSREEAAAFQEAANRANDAAFESMWRERGAGIARMATDPGNLQDREARLRRRLEEARSAGDANLVRMYNSQIDGFQAEVRARRSTGGEGLRRDRGSETQRSSNEQTSVEGPGSLGRESGRYVVRDEQGNVLRTTGTRQVAVRALDQYRQQESWQQQRLGTERQRQQSLPQPISNDQAARWSNRAEAIRQARDTKPPLNDLLQSPSRNEAQAIYGGRFGDLQSTVTGVERLQRGNRLRIRGNITGPNGRPVGTFTRVIDADDGVVHHQFLSLDPQYQGQGFATAFNRNAEDWYIANGIRQVRVSADLNVGGYTWAKAGFDFVNESDARGVLSGIRRRAVQVGNRELVERIDGYRNVPFDSDEFPTAAEMAMLGWSEGARTWPGKEYMLGSHWEGVKRLEPPPA